MCFRKRAKSKNTFDMFSRTYRLSDVLSILSCHVETVVLMSKVKE